MTNSSTMNEKVLFVDDDDKILKGIRRQFDDILELETASGPGEALEMLAQQGPFAVVVSDMRMPGMNGIELLARVRERSPDTVRIMLTGYADLQTTIDAVNAGNIFRFLSKPCTHEVMGKAVRDGLAQHRIVTAERELLEGTLHGSIRVLSEMLSLANPLAFGRTSQVQRIALAIGEQLKIPSLWDLKIATMLFPLGCVSVSQSTLERALAGQPLSKEEGGAFSKHPAVAQRMLRQIPRLEAVAAIVAYQDKGFDGSGSPDEGVSGGDIPIGARILKVASDFEIAYKRVGDTSQALQELEGRTGKYDLQVLRALQEALRGGLCRASRKSVRVQELNEGMVLAADVRTGAGQLMVASGQQVTESIRNRLCDLCMRGAIANEFQVEVLGEVETTELVAI